MKLILLLHLIGALVLAFMSSSAAAYDFYVGGKAGWSPSPKEAYNSWASRNRFQLNDRLVFRYEKGKDSVLVVDKVAYDACDATNPISSYADGNSVVQFNRSGPLFFISGASGHCEGGQQKLTVVVMAIRNHTQASPPPISSPPVASPPIPGSESSASPSGASPTQSPRPSPSPSSSAPSRAVVNVGLIIQASLALMAWAV